MKIVLDRYKKPLFNLKSGYQTFDDWLYEMNPGRRRKT
jgi:hypothetical protein